MQFFLRHYDIYIGSNMIVHPSRPVGFTLPHSNAVSQSTGDTEDTTSTSGTQSTSPDDSIPPPLSPTPEEPKIDVIPDICPPGEECLPPHPYNLHIDYLH